MRGTFPQAILDPVPPSLLARLRGDLSAARRARDRETTLVLSTVIAEARNREIDQRRTLEDGDIVEVLTRGIKQRRGAAEQARRLGRSDLADVEEAQADVLEAYLPEALDEQEVRRLVHELIEGGATDMGEVMRRLMPEIRGRFDGGVASRIVRDELSP